MQDMLTEEVMTESALKGAWKEASKGAYHIITVSICPIVIIMIILIIMRTVIYMIIMTIPMIHCIYSI